MNRSSQKTWCRRGFVLFCALPTLLVAGWIASRGIQDERSIQKDDLERELAAQLGMKVNIGALGHPTPFVVELKNVEVREAETGRLVSRAAAIELSRSQDGYVIELIAPDEEGKLIAAQMARTARSSHVFTRRAPGAGGPQNVLRQR